ncbi:MULTISPECIES: lysozyme inhibitor LprI family protein [Ralstonia solanacearum species complex]|nr:lysozyme inhibitor LprI family protein [Ralstonia solanacearum]ALF90123.1 hypothetical protein RSUY_38140 [Ralstonia solanacearum]ATI29608.1 hypothetical protein CCY86_19100 [Ralstonia solanacearum]ATJ88359.1 hypothetical protein CDC59_18980 [Ralstonia solanacearum]KEI30749.1 hypothetical protein CQ06_04370 [Ralstonia solanacearum]KFX78594.1 hypothetical protein KR98_13035 [Ralstonia solanacearum]
MALITHVLAMRRKLKLLIPLLMCASLTYAADRASCAREESTDRIVACIEAGTYDPCDWGGGPHSFSAAQCGRVSLEIADRTLRATIQRVAQRLRQGNRVATLADFERTQQQWATFRKNYCRFVAGLDPDGSAGNWQVLTSDACEVRLIKARNAELEILIDADY